MSPRWGASPSRAASIHVLNHRQGDEQPRPRARAIAGSSSWRMSMSLRVRFVIARSKHRTAYICVEIETQFGPTTSRPDQGAKTTSRPLRRREWHLRGSVGRQAAERLRTEPCDPHCRTRHGRTLSRSQRLCGGAGHSDSRQGRHRNRPDRERAWLVGIHLARVFSRATHDHWPGGAAAIDGAEAGAQTYCVGGPAGCSTPRPSNSAPPQCSPSRPRD